MTFMNWVDEDSLDTSGQGSFGLQSQEPLDLSPRSASFDADITGSSDHLNPDYYLSFGLPIFLDPDYFPERQINPYDISDAACSTIPSESFDTDEPHSSPEMDMSMIPMDKPISGNKSSLRLRTASHKSKNLGRGRPVRNEGEEHSRRCHNLVEKNYRSRLKAHFETLLAVLPMAQTIDGKVTLNPLNPDQFLSKGQVLDAARDRIVELERELVMQTAEARRLAKVVELYKAKAEWGFDGNGLGRGAIPPMPGDHARCYDRAILCSDGSMRQAPPQRGF